MKSPGRQGPLASQVSEITKKLDERGEEFRSSPLQAEYPFIWIDALYEKVRCNGRVVSLAIMIAYGVDMDMDRKREALAAERMWEGTEDWANEYAYIKADKIGPLLEESRAN